MRQRVKASMSSRFWSASVSVADGGSRFRIRLSKNTVSSMNGHLTLRPGCFTWRTTSPKRMTSACSVWSTSKKVDDTTISSTRAPAGPGDETGEVHFEAPSGVAAGDCGSGGA